MSSRRYVNSNVMNHVARHKAGEEAIFHNGLSSSTLNYIITPLLGTYKCLVTRKYTTFPTAAITAVGFSLYVCNSGVRVDFVFNSHDMS